MLPILDINVIDLICRTVRRAFHVISEEVQRYSPDMYLKSIANLLFLRFLSPAIVSPPPGKSTSTRKYLELGLILVV